MVVDQARAGPALAPPAAWAILPAPPPRAPMLPAPPPVRGTVHILIERCKGCEFCVEYCPTGVLALSDEFNVKGYHYPVVVSADECIACQACSTICPEYAIFALPADQGRAAAT